MSVSVADQAPCRSKRCAIHQICHCCMQRVCFISSAPALTSYNHPDCVHQTRSFHISYRVCLWWMSF